MWSYWISLYVRTHCVARGLRPQTLAAYEDALHQFRDWMRLTRSDCPPDAVAARDVLRYLQHLREDRGNGDSAVNRALVVLRSFYRAIVAMGHLAPASNPMAGFPSIKAVPRKLPVSLSPEQVSRLLDGPTADTLIGLRDRTLLVTLVRHGHSRFRVRIAALWPGGSGAPHDHRQRQGRTRTHDSAERGSGDPAAELRPGSRTIFAERAILPLTFRRGTRPRCRLRACADVGPAKPRRYSTLTASHAPHICDPPCAQGRRPRHHPRSARSSADHQHSNLSACDG